jgi:NAD(P)-dependent dehydrogenase (short-subunit alcohol dehydrogenase family)
MSKAKATAVILGAYGGMGSAIAERLASNGYNLVLLGRNAQRLSAVKSQLTASYAVQIADYVVDATDANAMAAVAEQVATECKHVTVLVNAVGRVPVGGVLEVTEEDWHSTLQTSLMSAVRLVTYFSPLLFEQHASSIILINGMLSLQPEPNFVISSTVTGAIRNFAKAISRDLSQHGVRVNLLNPGATATPLWEQVGEQIANKYALDRQQVAQQAQLNNPLKRIAEVEDIANAVEFLVSDKARYLNGVALSIDGGVTSGC